MTLKGCPSHIYGDFGASRNELRSLAFGPKVVEGNVALADNHLAVLDGLPNRIGGNLYVDHNPLIRLTHCSDICGTVRTPPAQDVMANRILHGQGMSR